MAHQRADHIRFEWINIAGHERGLRDIEIGTGMGPHFATGIVATIVIGLFLDAQGGSGFNRS